MRSPSRSLVHAMVTDALKAELALVAPLSFVSAKDVENARTKGQLLVTPKALITPLARDTAKRMGVNFVDTTSASSKADSNPSPEVATPAPVVALGADHGGYEAKQTLREFLEAETDLVILDCGCFSKDSVDYPDYGHRVASAIQRGEAGYGVLIDGRGIGSCMVANRHGGVRAAVLRDVTEAAHSRQHNNANVGCFAGSDDPKLIQACVLTLLTTAFEGGRHERRVRGIEIG